MKCFPYAIYAGHHGDQKKGFETFRGAFPTAGNATQWAWGTTYDWWQCVDTQAGRIVAIFERNP